MDSFFGIGLPELILILVIAGVVMGPERIVHIAHWLGKTIAQLQSISRAFVRQISSEVEGVDDGQLRRDMEMLQRDLQELRSGFYQNINSISQNTTELLQKTENSIAPSVSSPPNSLSRLAAPPAQPHAAQPANKTANGRIPTTTPINLPKPVDVADDPES